MSQSDSKNSAKSNIQNEKVKTIQPLKKPIPESSGSSQKNKTSSKL